MNAPWNAPISDRFSSLCARVFSPAAAILESEKTLGTRLFPTSLIGDVTSEIAEDDWERGWDFLILFSPFRIHAVLKLAPVLSQKSRKMHLVRTFCSSTAKTSTVTPIFYFMILIRTVLPFGEKKIGTNLRSVFWQFY